MVRSPDTKLSVRVLGRTRDLKGWLSVWCQCVTMLFVTQLAAACAIALDPDNSVGTISDNVAIICFTRVLAQTVAKPTLQTLPLENDLLLDNDNNCCW